MPFELSTYFAKERTLHTDIQLEGMSELLGVDYYPNRVNEARAALDRIRKNPQIDNYADAEEAFLSVIAAWDATMSGEAIPLTHEGLAAVGIGEEFLLNVVSAVVAESYAGEANGTRLRKRLGNSSSMA